MEVIETKSWGEAKEAFVHLARQRASLWGSDRGDIQHHPSPLLFRGHGDQDWTLSTTLQRTTNHPVYLVDYYRHILKTQPQVEAFTADSWELIGLGEYTDWADNLSDLGRPEFPGYEYMVYLRHHGFPSPLLDWSASPYVAAYFACARAPLEAQNIAIYCYLETCHGAKSWASNEPLIAVKGPYVRSHRRHFLQQCHYTICSNRNDMGLFYEDHEVVFGLERKNQDLLWKILMPRTQVQAALKDLDTMNVNALSLMGSEDSLIETLAVREYKQ